MALDFKILICSITLPILFSCTQNDGYAPTSTNTPATSTPCSTCKIFVTSQTFNGNLGGVSGADQKCNDDAQSGSDSYKALIGGRGGDWPLQANTIYVNAGGQTIGTSNGSAQFDFPLTNAIGAGNVWTGIAANWSNFNTCISWNSSFGGENSNGGNAASTGTGMLNTFINTCEATNALYCVQQF